MPRVNKTLLSDLLSLGVRRGGHLLVHSSYRALGLTEGPETVIDTLLHALGADGTLLMPTLSYDTVNEDQPFFDIRQTPSCVGIIPETFRRRAGVRRSLCPTHSVTACGRDAAIMTAEHLLDDTPVGPHSPFRKLKDMGGQILFIGCGLMPNTSMHGVEELVNPPYLFAPGHVNYNCVDENANIQKLRIRRHLFTLDGRAVVQRYDRVSDVLTGDALLYGRVLAADSFLLDAERLWRTAETVLREDPLYFVDVC